MPGIGGIASSTEAPSKTNLKIQNQKGACAYACVSKDRGIAEYRWSVSYCKPESCGLSGRVESSPPGSRGAAQVRGLPMSSSRKDRKISAKLLLEVRASLLNEMRRVPLSAPSFHVPSNARNHFLLRGVTFSCHSSRITTVTFLPARFRLTSSQRPVSRASVLQEKEPCLEIISSGSLCL